MVEAARSQALFMLYCVCWHGDVAVPLLMTSSVRQEFVPPDREVMTRNAFRRTALETRCQLYFPGPDEDIVLLRTGFLKHIQVPSAGHHSGLSVNPVLLSPLIRP